MSNECPDCGSADTAKVSVIYSTGTTRLNAVSPAIGMDAHGHVAGGVATTTGTVQSLQAQSIAPPKKPTNAGPGCAVYVVVLVGYFFLNAMLVDMGMPKDSFGQNLFAFAAIFGGAVAVGYWASAKTKSQMPAWEAAMDAWSKNWMCKRCGKVFTP
jgi:hypothetical protein